MTMTSPGMSTQPGIQQALPWFEGPVPLAPMEPFARFVVEPAPGGLSRVTFAESPNTGRVGLGTGFPGEPEALAFAETLAQLDPATIEHAERLAEDLTTEAERPAITRPARYAGSCWPVLLTVKGEDFARFRNTKQAEAIAAHLETLP